MNQRSAIVILFAATFAQAACATETGGHPDVRACPCTAASAAPNAASTTSSPVTLSPNAQARLEELEKIIEVLEVQANKGQIRSDELVAAWRRWHDVYRDAHVGGPAYVSAAERYHSRLERRVAQMEERYKSGSVSETDVRLAKYFLLEAQQWLEDARSGKLP